MRICRLRGNRRRCPRSARWKGARRPRIETPSSPRPVGARWGTHPCRCTVPTRFVTSRSSFMAKISMESPRAPLAVFQTARQQIPPKDSYDVLTWDDRCVHLGYYFAGDKRRYSAKKNTLEMCADRSWRVGDRGGRADVGDMARCNGADCSLVLWRGDARCRFHNQKDARRAGARMGGTGSLLCHGWRGYNVGWCGGPFGDQLFRGLNQAANVT